MPRRLLPLLLLLTTAPLPAEPGVLAAEEALKALQVAPGFRVELAAVDPLIGDPVAMTIGPDGRLWVVELRGDIAVLEDTNGDGRYDQRTVFLDHLVLPRALALVGDGVLVAEPPHLWFCRDTNGDGVADEKTEAFSDYGGTTNPEHPANGLMWALDNWIYSASHPQRYRYLGGGKFLAESALARGQWGLAQDDTGRLYYNRGRDPLRADLVPSAYLRRNPGLVRPAGANVQLAPADPTGRAPAACAPLIYRSPLFGPGFHGNAFVVEAGVGRVLRLVLTEAGGTVTARNADWSAEFLTSTDPRFHPVNTASGPDGALYVVDLYRAVSPAGPATIFPPLPADGTSLGRIYRIVPEDAMRVKTKFNLATESSERLVARLRAGNSWWRDTAQRLLVERRDPASVAPLRELARSGPPLARLHALWTLEGIGQIDRATVVAALEDGDDRVLAAAIRLSEQWLASGTDPDLYQRVVRTGIGAAPAVTLQLALALGESPTPGAVADLTAIAARAGRQPLVADAIVSGLAGRESAFLKLAAAPGVPDAAAPAVTLAASAVLKTGRPAQVTAVLALLDARSGAPAWVRGAVLDGVERFLPKTPEGESVAGTIAVEPRPLLQLSVQGGAPGAGQAARLSGLLKWPGKPGLEAEAAAIAARLTPEQKALFDKGRDVFASVCAACHQPGGEGMAGLAPQLLFSRYVLGNERQVIRIVLNGKEKEGLVMPPLRALDDESIAAVLTYLRLSWGHRAAPVSPAAVAAVRAAVGSREAPWSEEELQGVP